MRVLIAAAGSYGDVAPYTGLGCRLRDAGFRVAVAAPEQFADLVTRAGLEFRGIAADPSGGPGGGGGMMRRAAVFMRELGQGMAALAASGGADVLLLSTTTAPLGWHLAEALGIPALGVYLQPVAPTVGFPPVVAAGRSLGPWGNRAAGRLALRVVDRMHAEAARELRDTLGLPRAAQPAVRKRLDRVGWTVLHGFSSALLPRPDDWRAGLEVVGNWWPHCPQDARLPQELADFLDAGPPPVFIGFGSMAAGEGERLGGIAVRALKEAGLRGVLQAGAAGLHAVGDDVLTVGEVPHRLLFPRTAAVVHHAGAGTTAAALRAGVPAVPVPVTADQPFWAGRVAALGAAAGPLPFKELSAPALARALRAAVEEPDPRARAAAVARRMAAEDGAGHVVREVERLLSR
ncbi:glycosyltransferase family 1 protein [Streptomyces sp. BR123]|uniref:glycosyltransferase n=1 Tax=Streptomyces sp. BR123 TaxID=2749828 RepID=UPI0015C485EE|nr:glycosyltransferase [Streptomyces sp. BR123]NXY98102.1 glycosyltransferase family 1 protein [Streptomyces sp. BR123]